MTATEIKSLLARYWAELRAASTRAAGEAVISAWSGQQQANDARLYEIRSRLLPSSYFINEGYPTTGPDWERAVAAGRTRGMGSAAFAAAAEYAWRGSLKSGLTDARDFWQSRLLEFVNAAAIEQAKITEDIAVVVDTLSSDVDQLAEVTGVIASKVQLTPEEAAQVQNVIASVRANRAAARGRIDSVLARTRSLISNLEDGKMTVAPAAESGGLIIMAFGAVATYFALKG